MHAAVGDDKEWSEYLMPKLSDSTSSSMWHVLGPVIDHDKIISNKYRSICGNASSKEFKSQDISFKSILLSVIRRWRVLQLVSFHRT